MTGTRSIPLSLLYERDETDWLERMAAMVRERRLDDLDLENLAEYLGDMAGRDRREVKSRLRILLAHLLKWDHQPDRRSGSWRATILIQARELADEAGRGVLRSHAEAVLDAAYRDARELASAETELPIECFPLECPYSIEQILDGELLLG